MRISHLGQTGTGNAPPEPEVPIYQRYPTADWIITTVASFATISSALVIVPSLWKYARGRLSPAERARRDRERAEADAKKQAEDAAKLVARRELQQRVLRESVSPEYALLRTLRNKPPPSAFGRYSSPRRRR